MKKNLNLLIMAVLAVCLLSLTFDRLIHLGVVHSSSDSQPLLHGIAPVEKQSAAPAPSAQPFALVVTGLICLLFGIIAVSPLFLEDPPR